MTRMNELDLAQKYRPKTFDEVILSDEVRQKLSRFVKDGGGMSFLFWGLPGCGKTTVGKLINPDNTFYINCSTQNSIETVRWIEAEFECGMVNGKRRVVLLDEADNLSQEAQAALRGVAEELSHFNDFVLTANNPNLLTDALRSRFLPVNFDLEKTEEMINLIANRMKEIADKEGLIEPRINLIREVVESRFPDIRRITKTIQLELVEKSKK